MNEKATALIIDDEPQIRRLLRILLEQEQYRALESDSGRHGLSEIALRRPDVVLLDLGLPISTAWLCSNDYANGVVCRCWSCRFAMDRKIKSRHRCRRG